MRFLKKSIFVILMFVTTVIHSQNIDSLFVNMPDIINPVLNKTIRRTMLKGFKLNQNDSTVNVFMRYSKLLRYDSLENHLFIRNTTLSTFEMKKFRLNDGVELIGIIRTYGDSLKNSNITFYNTDWSVSQLRFEIPEAKNWLDRNKLINSTLDATWVENQLRTSFIELNFIDKGLEIEAKNNTYFYLSDETKKTLKPFFYEKTMKYVYSDKEWMKRE